MTLLFDTNIVSELRKPAHKVDARVASWAATLPLETVWLSAISVLELEIGVRRKEHNDPAQGALLRRWLNDQVSLRTPPPAARARPLRGRRLDPSTNR